MNCCSQIQLVPFPELRQSCQPGNTAVPESSRIGRRSVRPSHRADGWVTTTGRSATRRPPSRTTSRRRTPSGTSTAASKATGTVIAAIRCRKRSRNRKLAPKKNPPSIVFFLDLSETCVCHLRQLLRQDLNFRPKCSEVFSASNFFLFEWVLAQVGLKNKIRETRQLKWCKISRGAWIPRANGNRNCKTSCWKMFYCCHSWSR